MLVYTYSQRVPPVYIFHLIESNTIIFVRPINKALRMLVFFISSHMIRWTIKRKKCFSNVVFFELFDLKSFVILVWVPFIVLKQAPVWSNLLFSHMKTTQKRFYFRKLYWFGRLGTIVTRSIFIYFFLMKYSDCHVERQRFWTIISSVHIFFVFEWAK